MMRKVQEESPTRCPFPSCNQVLCEGTVARQKLGVLEPLCIFMFYVNPKTSNNWGCYVKLCRYHSDRIQQQARFLVKLENSSIFFPENEGMQRLRTYVTNVWYKRTQLVKLSGRMALKISVRDFTPQPDEAATNEELAATVEDILYLLENQYLRLFDNDFLAESVPEKEKEKEKEYSDLQDTHPASLPYLFKKMKF